VIQILIRILLKYLIFLYLFITFLHRINLIHHRSEHYSIQQRYFGFLAIHPTTEYALSALSYIFSLTFAITGSEKRGDEGAPLFAVRVDGVVGHTMV